MLKCIFTSLFPSANAKKKKKRTKDMIIWDCTTIYTIWNFYLNCVKDIQRQYQNGLILHLARENQDFHKKINVYIF